MIKHDKKFLIDFLGLQPLFRSEKKTPTITNPVLELKKIEEKAKNCVKCTLCESRKSVVFGSGDLTRPWMFVGEAPGESPGEALETLKRLLERLWRGSWSGSCRDSWRGF